MHASLKGIKSVRGAMLYKGKFSGDNVDYTHVARIGI